MTLPLVFYYLITLTSDRQLMKSYANNAFQKNFSTAATVVIFIASIATLVAAIFNV